MIPYAILTGEYRFVEQETIEFRILDLSSEGFTFRVPEAISDMGQGLFRLHFFSFLTQDWTTVELFPGTYTIFLEEPAEDDEEEYRIPAEFCSYYRVITEDTAFFTCQKKLTEEYLRYIALKTAGDDGAMSKALTGYPAEKEDLYAEKWEKQKQDLLRDLKPDGAWEENFHRFPELALQLDHSKLWNRYLELPFFDFMNEFREKLFVRQFEPGTNCLIYHPIVRQFEPGTICLGNQFCRHLFPTQPERAAILAKAEKEGLRTVFYLAPVPQEAVEETMQLLMELAAASERLELVVNDLGTLRLICDKFPNIFQVTAGTLLQKMKKDVRMSWKIGASAFTKEQKNAWYSDFYPEYMKELGVSGLLLETAGTKALPPAELADIEMGSSILFPFYQMNTAGYCTLYAACHNEARGKQTFVRECPKYCEREHFLYPAFLRMVGAYNSLFGYDEAALEDADYLEQLYEAGVRRLILQLP